MRRIGSCTSASGSVPVATRRTELFPNGTDEDGIRASSPGVRRSLPHEGKVPLGVPIDCCPRSVRDARVVELAAVRPLGSSGWYSESAVRGRFVRSPRR